MQNAELLSKVSFPYIIPEELFEAVARKINFYIPKMSLESSFLIEFPANRDYIPFIQDFLRDFLKNYDFSKEFSEYAVAESSEWFNSVISEEKFLHALPTIFFNCRSDGHVIAVEIQTSDQKEFITSLSSQNLEEKNGSI